MTRVLCAVALAASLALPIALAQSVESCEQALDRWEFPQAEKIAQALVEHDPASATGHILLARAYMGRNQPELAFAALNRAIKIDGRNLDALYYLTKLTGVLSEQQHLAVLQMAPNSARGHQLKAEGHAAHNEAAEAEREYLAALEQKPGAASVLVALGELKRIQGEFRDALSWYLKVTAAQPTFYDALYGAGACYYRLKEYDNALEYFRRSLDADPSSLAAKLALAQALLMMSRPAEAVPLLEAVVKADPNLKRSYYLLARAYTGAGRKEKAAEAFQRFHSIVETGSEQDPSQIGTNP